MALPIEYQWVKTSHAQGFDFGFFRELAFEMIKVQIFNIYENLRQFLMNWMNNFLICQIWNLSGAYEESNALSMHLLIRMCTWVGRDVVTMLVKIV